MIIYQVKCKVKHCPMPEPPKKVTPGMKIFLTDTTEDGMFTFCQLSEWNGNAEKEFKTYLERHQICGKVVSREEIPVTSLASAMDEGSENGLCPRSFDVLTLHHMMPFTCEPFSSAITEMRFVSHVKPETALRKCASLHSPDLTAEIARIVERKEQKFVGHPAVYAMCAERIRDAEKMTELMLFALRGAGHLASDRACSIDLCEGVFPSFALDDIYKTQSGSVVILKLDRMPEDNESFHRMSELQTLHTNLEHFASYANKHRSNVLTVFQFSGETQGLLELVRKTLGDAPLLTLREGVVPRAQAMRVLRGMAHERGVADTKTLGTCLPKGQKEFSASELETRFARWYDNHLATEAYPQYAVLQEKKQDDIPKRSDAMEELQSLIGLQDAKRIIAQANAFGAAQKLYRERGFAYRMPSLHMAFSGNPGTAKTTVARLAARIFKDSGILEKGELVEVGRGDLVGRYVGWTAKTVREKFEEAKGSVLFIDEAYALLDDKEGQFGDEAINTIVQEMENHRDDTVVIFAGYSEPMDRLFSRNAGLRSRVTFHVDFPDYSEDELLDIFRKVLRENGRAVTELTEQKVRRILRDGMARSDFGNGRFVRSLVEQALLAQASRIMAKPRDTVTDDDIRYLTADDFTEEESKPKERSIGFAV